MTKRQNYCVDCGAEIYPRSTRCHPCAAIAYWKHGNCNSEERSRKLSQITKARWERGDFEGRSTEKYLRKKSLATKDAHKRGLYSGSWRHRISESVTAVWERGDYGEERNCKISKGLEVAHRRGDFDGVSEALRSAHQRGDFDGVSEAMKAAWQRGDFDGRKIVFQSPTSIELQVATALDIMGIEHMPQYRPDGIGWIYDELVPPNILIEVQGDYWHGDQKPEQQKRDAEKAQWAKENGYELIEIWECEINERGAGIILQDLGIPRDTP